VMKDYKDVAHNLYAIQRKEEIIKSSFTKTLPIMLNQNKNIMEAACMGNVKEMCDLMITQNLSIKDITALNVFNKACNLGHLRLLKFLESLMDRETFVRHVLKPNHGDSMPIHQAVHFGWIFVVRYLFSMKEIQEAYQNDDVLLFRLLMALLCQNVDDSVTEFVMKACNISKEKLLEMLKYVCPEQPFVHWQAPAWHKYRLLNSTVYWGSSENFYKLNKLIGRDALLDNVFDVDGHGREVIEYCIRQQQNEVIQYLFEIDEIKQKYLSNDDLLHQLVGGFIRCSSHYKDCVAFAVNEFGLTKERLMELNDYQSIDYDVIIPLIK